MTGIRSAANTTVSRLASQAALGLLGAVVIVGGAACASSSEGTAASASVAPPTSTAPGSSAPAPITAAPAETAAPSPSVEVAPNPVGFAVAAEDVLTFYTRIGYTCSEQRLSTQATGYSFRSCDRVDPAFGPPCTIGVVTDPGGLIGNAFARVEVGGPLGAASAMDPLARFLQVMLGNERAAAQVEWLAAHVGEAYAETSDGGLRIATYIQPADDHTAIFLELAGQAYLDTHPRPSG